MSSLSGLSEQEALARRQRGQGNNIHLATSRSYIDILRQNIVNLINIVLFTIGVIMIVIGRPGDAFVSVGIILMNIVIGVYQQARAKQKLDKIALLTRPRVTVMRDGAEKVVDPAELVIGDVMIARPGDQFAVDGVVIGEGKMEVDESLLTGESDRVVKSAGDTIFSGSFCVSGSAAVEVTKVGAESFANKLTASARAYKVVKTPLQKDVEFVIRVLMLLALFLGFLLLVSASVSQIPLVRSVQMAAVIAGIVPNGLFFMVIVAYALGAVRIASRGALIQQSNSVESLSNVNILCMDKTGTLTANRILYQDSFPIGIEKAKLESLLGDFAASASVNNRTGEAIAQALPGKSRKIVDEVPFSSALKWSALAFDEPDLRGVYVLGALEMLQAYLPPEIDFSGQVKTWSDAGLRVLIFAYHPEVTSLHDSQAQPRLPMLTPLGLLSFSDELRDEARETLAGFAQAGIRLKVISGDNPHTVAALARQAGLTGDLRVVSGTELAQMDSAQFVQAAEEAMIFGRITPEQKEKLVDALRAKGHYVAMIGDGVNDVLSLKKANLGIAMQSGSAATRGVADMVLLNDSFASLPPAFLEGQRIISGMQDILRLFLTRALYVALLILAVGVVGVGFPYPPKHAALAALLTVGAPTLGLAIWARPEITRHRLVRSVVHFVIPAALTFLVFGLIVYVSAFIVIGTEARSIRVTPEEIAAFVESANIDFQITSQDQYAYEVALLFAQTSLTTFSMLAGLVLVIFVEPPLHFFAGGDRYSGDWRPTILAGAMLLVFALIKLIPDMRTFFELVLLEPVDYLVIGGVVIVWALALRWIWRSHLLERFLQIEPDQFDLWMDR